MRIEERILTKMREAAAIDYVEESEARSKAWDEVETLFDEGYGTGGDGVFPRFTQDELVEFLEITREQSWDIPSAMMHLCDQDYSDDAGYEFPMHRNGLWPIEEAAWPKIAVHFKEVHGLDIDDLMINWSFDT